MSALTVWSLVSLLVQIATLVMLIFAYYDYKRRHDAKVHGAVTSAAYLLNLVTIIFIMVPTLIDSLADISAMPSEPVHVLIIVHVPLAIVATLLASFVVFRWVENSFDPKGCRGRRLMEATMITWSVSIVLGVIVYLAHLVE